MKISHSEISLERLDRCSEASSMVRMRSKLQHVHPTNHQIPAGIVNWPQEEIDSIDVKTWKLLTIHKELHLKSSFL